MNVPFPTPAEWIFIAFAAALLLSIAVILQRRARTVKSEPVPITLVRPATTPPPAICPPEMVRFDGRLVLPIKYIPDGMTAGDWVNLSMTGHASNYKRDIELPSGWVLRGVFPTVLIRDSEFVGVSVDHLIAPASAPDPFSDIPEDYDIQHFPAVDDAAEFWMPRCRESYLRQHPDTRLSLTSNRLIGARCDSISDAVVLIRRHIAHASPRPVPRAEWGTPPKLHPLRDVKA